VINGWTWIVRYAIACCLALVLAAVLGGSQLFQNARVTPNGPSAADLVRFFGEGAALVLLWLAADRAARSLPEDGRERSVARHALLPLATLVVLALAYPVPLLLLHPVMTDTAMMGYRWLFVLAITAAAVWLVLTVSRDAEALSPALSRLAARFRASAAARRARTDSLAVPTKPALRCPACGEVLPPGQTTCAKCGRQAAA